MNSQILLQLGCWSSVLGFLGAVVLNYRMRPQKYTTIETDAYCTTPTRWSITENKKVSFFQMTYTTLLEIWKMWKDDKLSFLLTALCAFLLGWLSFVHSLFPFPRVTK